MSDMKSATLSSAAAVALSAVFASPVIAYEDVDAVAPGGKGFVGLAALAKPDYEGSDDNKVTPAPFGKYIWASGRWANLGGTGGSETAARLSLNLITRDSSEAWTFGPLLQYRLKRDDVDNRQVDDMKSVDAATELGVFVGFKTGPWSTELSFSGDVSDEHDGYLVYLKGGYELMKTSKILLALGARTSWADSNYMDTYFGVDSKNVRNSGLPFYNADSGFKDIGLNLTGIYYFNKTWAAAANTSYTRMLNDAEDSPLVEGNQGVGDKNQLAGILAVLYSF
jgi:outer membrane scaffolding protein for murein synthesis (MipA/OmpV family)